MKKIPFNTNIDFFFVIAHLCRRHLHQGPEDGPCVQVWYAGVQTRPSTTPSGRRYIQNKSNSSGGRWKDVAKSSTNWNWTWRHPRPACLLRRQIWTPHKTVKKEQITQHVKTHLLPTQPTTNSFINLAYKMCIPIQRTITNGILTFLSFISRTGWPPTHQRLPR